MPFQNSGPIGLSSSLCATFMLQLTNGCWFSDKGLLWGRRHCHRPRVVSIMSQDCSL